MGNADVEPKLIEALAWDNGWRQVNACGALGKIGSRKALPALEKLAKDDRYTGALKVKGVAEFAIERITKREKRRGRHPPLPPDLRERIARSWERTFEEWGYKV